MTGKRRKIFLIISVMLLFLAVMVYFFQFNSYGYLMTVPCRPAFTEIADHVYINKSNAREHQEILDLIERAEERVRAFFGDLRFSDETIFVICDDERLTRKLGEDHATVTISFPFEKHYICISDEYLDLDILAHEITHAELRARLTARAQGKIPAWFDEGLAVQNDDRERYSEAQWIAQTGNGERIVALEEMDTPAEFYAGTAEDRRFRYLNAKHELGLWMASHGRQGLLELIENLNDGADFHTAYGR